MCCLFIGSASAQQRKLKKADRYFQALNYQKAIQYYLDVLDKRDLSRAKIKVAESYRKIGNMNEAAFWYGQVVRLPEVEPLHKLYYAQALQATDKCEQADKWFKEYAAEVPSDERGQILRNACEPETVNQLKSVGSDYYRTQQLEDVNTTLDEFGASFFRQGIVFTSERDRGAAIRRIHTWTGDPFLELYYAEIKSAANGGYEFGLPVKYSSTINTKFHDGPVCFNKTQDRIYFTRNNIEGNRIGRDGGGVVRLKILTARLENNEWRDVESMSFNSEEYSTAHPTVTADGEKMYFTSDMPGGMGGMDLYVTMSENGRWGPAINMNAYVPGINTEGDEIFPFIHDDGTLYFASNGHAGLGGLDIFYSNDVDGAWSPVANMGAPINSNADDFSLTFSDDKSIGFYSSNRAGGNGNDDLYMFQREAVDVELLVYDKNSGEPLEAATVEMNCNEREFTTGGDGRIFFEMPLSRTCRIEADKDDYKANSAAASTKGYKSGEKLLVSIPLDRPLEFSLEGKITATGGQSIGKTSLTITNDCGEPVDVMETNSSGGFNLKLRPGCCYLIKAQKQGYLVSTENICTRGRTSSQNITADLALNSVPTKTDEVVEVVEVETGGTTTIPPTITPPNFPIPPARPLGFPTLYHDFDRASVQELYQDELMIIYNLIQANPSVIIEIGSHTDARGPSSYNDKLSARRAGEVAQYLKERGVSEGRFSSRGYGESQIINGCTDGVKCSEEQHQENRRTEVNVVGNTN